MNIKELPNRDLLEALDKGVMIERFKNSDEWKLVNEAAKRLSMAAQEELLKVDASETTKIIELQQIVKLYRDVLGGIVNSFTQEGQLAFDEAKERELIHKDK